MVAPMTITPATEAAASEAPRAVRPYGEYGATLPVVRVSQEMADSVAAGAEMDGVSISDIIRAAVSEYLRKHYN